MNERQPSTLLIEQIGLLATPFGSAPKSREAGEIRKIPNAYLAVHGGCISEIGQGEAPARLRENAKVIQAQGKLVTPGLVDSHTHLIFGGWRQHEMALKVKGVPYLEILQAGGGILSTVKATRALTRKELAEKALPVLKEMLSFGVTTCEIKSGYGLDITTELKQLYAVQDAARQSAAELVPTFMGAHALPAEYSHDREAYLQLLEELLPKIVQEELAEFCDVFCEEGVFSAEESLRILEAGRRAGLIPKIHADEIRRIGGTNVAKKVHAISAEHLICCDEEGIRELKEGGVIACLLPLTSFYLGAEYAPARQMIQKGVPVAIATDFNPGSCPCANLQLAMTTAALRYRMTPEEVLTAVTLNGAAALNRASRIGSLEEGKQADILLWDAPDLDYICYRLGSNLVRTVIKSGTVQNTL